MTSCKNAFSQSHGIIKYYFIIIAKSPLKIVCDYGKL